MTFGTLEIMASLLEAKMKDIQENVPTGINEEEVSQMIQKLTILGDLRNSIVRELNRVRKATEVEFFLSKEEKKAFYNK